MFLWAISTPPTDTHQAICYVICFFSEINVIGELHLETTVSGIFFDPIWLLCFVVDLQGEDIVSVTSEREDVLMGPDLMDNKMGQESDQESDQVSLKHLLCCLAVSLSYFESQGLKYWSEVK